MMTLAPEIQSQTHPVLSSLRLWQPDEGIWLVD